MIDVRQGDCLTMTIPFPNKKYNIILADPPWKFAPMGIAPEKIHKNLATHSAAENHYKTMTISELKGLPVQAVEAKDSVLFMWVTAPFLSQSLDIMKTWGYKYKTIAFVWAKQRDSGIWAHAGGWYTLSQTELCLLGTRGKTVKRCSKNQKQLIVAKRTRHSEKPIEVYERIEAMYGEVQKLEMFARRQRVGWDCWGDEVDSSNCGITRVRTQPRQMELDDVTQTQP